MLASVYRPFGVILLSLCLVGPISPALAQDLDRLSDAEQKFFSRTFTQDPLEDRLSRLEETVFGTAQSGDAQQREEKLGKLLEKMVNKTPPKTQAASQQATGNSAAKPPDATDYPAITELESRIFQRTFANEDIARRLSRLEQNVFQQTYDELPMVDRVDQLTLKALPESPLTREESTMIGLPKSGKEFASSSVAVYSKLTALEEQFIGKSYGGELISQRLDRLERKAFGNPQAGTVDGRMDNLLTYFSHNYVKPQPYVGQAQAYTPQVPSGLTQPSQPQVVGSQMSFSPEMMQMLPPQVRQKLEARGQGAVAGIAPQQEESSSQTQVYSGPGTWTHQAEIVTPYGSPNSLVIPPGQIYRGYNRYNTLPPQSMPNVNPMNFPGGALGAIGQQPSISGQNNYYGQPMYQGSLANNNMGQSLTILESQVFGRSFDGSSIGIRLNNLEQQVFGRTYPQFPMPQRINRLMQRSLNHQGNADPLDPSDPLAQPQKPSILGNVMGQALNMLMYNQINRSGYLPSPYGYGYQQYGW